MPASKHSTYQGGERDEVDLELQALCQENDGARLLSRVTQDGNLIDRILASFAPSQSDPASKSLAIIVLSRAISLAKEGSGKVALVSAIAESLTEALNSKENEPFVAASEALTVLCALAPDVAATLIADPPEIGISDEEQDPTSQVGGHGLLEALFREGSRTSSDDRDRALANVLSAAGSVTPTKNILCGQTEAAKRARAWLDLQSRTKPATVSSALYTTLVAALARLKLQSRTSSPQQAAATSTTLLFPTDRGVVREQESELLDLASAAILRFSAPGSTRSDAEALRPALEALSLLSLLSRQYRSSLVARTSLLRALCSLVRARTRSVFPARGAGTSSTSTYELDEQLSNLGLQDTPSAPDTALHLSLASLLATLVTYPHARPGASKGQQDQQMEKLRRVASGMKSGDGDGEDEEVDSAAIVDARAKALQESGAVSALVAIVFGGSAHTVQKEGSGTLHHSSAVRRACSLALYGFCVRQDRTSRGQIVQQKGARALLALGSAAAEDASGSASRHAQQGTSTSAQPLDLTPSHALALLLIALPPSLVLGDAGRPAAAPLLAALLLSPSATALQRFEALLALTNMASEGGGAQIVADAHAPDAALHSGAGLFEGNSDSRNASDPHTVRDALEDVILFEPEQRIQRAAVELLCNLASTDERTVTLWSGQAEAEAAMKAENDGLLRILESSSGEHQSRARSRLHALVAFCAPAGESSTEPEEAASQSHHESGMPLRLAASGALAMLAGNTLTAPAHLLALQPRTLRHIARLIHSDVHSSSGGAPVGLSARIREVADDEATEFAAEQTDEFDIEEREAHEADLRAYMDGPTAARLALAHRGAAVAIGIVNYLQWRSDGGEKVPGFQGGSAEEERRTFKLSGILEALQAACSLFLGELRQGVEKGDVAGGRDGLMQERRDVVETALQAIKVAEMLGLRGRQG